MCWINSCLALSSLEIEHILKEELSIGLKYEIAFWINLNIPDKF